MKQTILEKLDKHFPSIFINSIGNGFFSVVGFKLVDLIVFPIRLYWLELLIILYVLFTISIIVNSIVYVTLDSCLKK